MLVYREKPGSKVKIKLSRGAYFSVIYHSIFDYPLKVDELYEWKVAERHSPKEFGQALQAEKGYVFVAGKQKSILKRKIREQLSFKKREIAKNAAEVLSLIPTVQFVGLTGSLAMNNATSTSDIDLLIITKENTLWSTRVYAYFLLILFGLRIRKPKNKAENDKLCLNIWLDEKNLKWVKKDLYTAHEIAQVMPLSDRGGYQKFMWANWWAKEFWPNRFEKKLVSVKSKEKTLWTKLFQFTNRICFLVQLVYMQGKRTREETSIGKAIFHPSDWGDIILPKLKNV